MRGFGLQPQEGHSEAMYKKIGIGEIKQEAPVDVKKEEGMRTVASRYPYIFGLLVTKGGKVFAL